MQADDKTQKDAGGHGDRNLEDEMFTSGAHRDCVYPGWQKAFMTEFVKKD
jgi:hypothetical protein